MQDRQAQATVKPDQVHIVLQLLILQYAPQLLTVVCARYAYLDPAKALVWQLEDVAHALSSSGIAQAQALLHCNVDAHPSERCQV